jgi:hypothetical protein
VVQEQPQTQKVVVVNHYNTVYESHSPSFSDYLMWHYWFGGNNNQNQQNYQNNQNNQMQQVQNAQPQQVQAQTYASTVRPSAPAQTAPSDHAVLWAVTSALGAGLIVVWLFKKFDI